VANANSDQRSTRSTTATERCPAAPVGREAMSILVVTPNLPFIQALYYIVGLATGIGGILLVGIGGIAAYRQLATSVKAREMQAIATLLAFTDQGEWRGIRRLLYRPEFRKGFEEVFEKLGKDDDYSKPLDEFLDTFTVPGSQPVTHDDLHGYAASLETVAMLVLYELAPNDLVTGYFGRIIDHHWGLLAPYRERVMERYPEFLQHLNQWNDILMRGRASDASRLEVFERKTKGPLEMWRRRRSLSLAKRAAIQRIHEDTMRSRDPSPTEGPGQGRTAPRASGKRALVIVGILSFVAGAAITELLKRVV